MSINTNSPNTGGPAFPCLERGLNGLDLTDHGMSLRDYFAGRAMQAYLTCGRYTIGELSKDAYAIADSMLKARAKMCPQRKPLTDDQINFLIAQHTRIQNMGYDKEKDTNSVVEKVHAFDLVRAVEAAHGIKEAK